MGHPMKSTLSRRRFIATSAAAAATSLAASAREPKSIHKQVKWPWDPQKGDFLDSRTRVKIRILSPADLPSEVIYQTHPMWVQNMNYLLFNAGPTEKRIPHLRQMDSGIIRPLATEPPGPMALAPKSGLLYHVKNRAVTVQNVISAFQRLRPATKITELPAQAAHVEGGLSVNASEDLVYVGVAFEGQEEWGILALNPRTQEWTTMARVPFRIGHVQAHPVLSGLIMFCHETGGDAPQRMWVVRAGWAKPKPFYIERFNEWVTHETWWGPNLALFTIWPYDEEHRKALHGILSIDLRGENIYNYAAHPIWHTHGSPDQQWILGDDFDRNIWLINARTTERRLLTQGHNGPGFKTHPHASFTPDSAAIVFTSSQRGTSEVFLAEIPEWDSLPPLKKK